MIKTRLGLGLTAAVVLGVIGVFGLGASGSTRLGLDRVIFVEPDPVPAWVQRLALVDEALGRSQTSMAIYEWREAYGAAVSARRSDALIAVAERAVRIAAHTGNSGYFLNEAKYIYLHAAGRARAERSREAILAIAEAFEKLGDAERAAQVRRIAENWS